MAKNRVKAFPKPVSARRTNKILIEGCKNIRKNDSDNIKLISLQISRKATEFYSKILVITLLAVKFLVVTSGNE